MLKLFPALLASCKFWRIFRLRYIGLVRVPLFTHTSPPVLHPFLQTVKLSPLCNSPRLVAALTALPPVSLQSPLPENNTPEVDKLFAAFLLSIISMPVGRVMPIGGNIGVIGVTIGFAQPFISCQAKVGSPEAKVFIIVSTISQPPKAMKIPMIEDVITFLPSSIRFGFPALVAQTTPPIRSANTKTGNASPLGGFTKKSTIFFAKVQRSHGVQYCPLPKPQVTRAGANFKFLFAIFIFYFNSISLAFAFSNESRRVNLPTAASSIKVLKILSVSSGSGFGQSLSAKTELAKTERVD